MRIFAVLFAYLVATLASPVINEDNDTVEVSNELIRATSGTAAKKGENLEFCYIVINFYSVQKTCGCFISSESYVVTSARCLFDCSEKQATNVTVFFPSKSGKEATRSFEQIIIPDGANGDANIPAYDPTMDTPVHTITNNNVGLIKLSSKITIDDKTAKIPIYPEGFDLADAYLFTNPAQRYKGCGVGWINNKGERAKGVVCTELNLVPSGQCKQLGTAEFLTPPENVACFQWANKDNNLCVGDYGGPIYVYENDASGKQLYQYVFCIAIGSPDSRPNASCQDGHTIYCQYITSPMLDWVTAIRTQAGTLKSDIKSIGHRAKQNKKSRQ